MMMGLPDSGKSTFVAALWEVVRSLDVPEAMTLGILNGDYTYINKLHKLWSEGKRLPRTEVGQEGIISIPLRNRSSKHNSSEQIEIILPDLSGESFDQQWEMRIMPTEYRTHLIEATGLLFFVHSQKFNPGDLLSFRTAELEKLLESDDDDKEGTKVDDQVAEVRVARAESTPPSEGTAAPIINPVPFEPKNAPTQTKIVDLLQQALWLTEPERLRKVALIISAWDLVQDRVGSPSEWVDTAMPLLSQFLNSNTERFGSRIYGISAQGGEYSDKTTVALLNKRNASERIKVLDGKIEHNNITAPLQWLMD